MMPLRLPLQLSGYEPTLMRLSSMSAARATSFAADTHMNSSSRAMAAATASFSGGTARRMLTDTSASTVGPATGLDAGDGDSEHGSADS